MTILVGHFGSGKTEIAINGALDLARQGRRAVLVDLDVVKPYFRSRSARLLMQEKGVEVVAPEGENIHADLPIIVPRIRTLVRRSDAAVILDAGGDPTGARVLGSLADVIPEDDTETFVVLNFNRPFTDTVEHAVGMVRGIEAAARRRATGLISNTHLMGETSAEIVRRGYELTAATARRLGVPVVAVTAEAGLAAEIVRDGLDCPVVAIERVVRPPFDPGNQQRTTGPLFVLN